MEKDIYICSRVCVVSIYAVTFIKDNTSTYKRGCVAVCINRHASPLSLDTLTILSSRCLYLSPLLFPINLLRTPFSSVLPLHRPLSICYSYGRQRWRRENGAWKRNNNDRKTLAISLWRNPIISPSRSCVQRAQWFGSIWSSESKNGHLTHHSSSENSLSSFDSI